MLHGCVGCYYCHFICRATARSHVYKAAQKRPRPATPPLPFTVTPPVVVAKVNNDRTDSVEIHYSSLSESSSNVAALCHSCHFLCDMATATPKGRGGKLKHIILHYISFEIMKLFSELWVCGTIGNYVFWFF
jgi:hypothetical protein